MLKEFFRGNKINSDYLCRGILIAASLAISHWVQKPNIRPFLVYDASISYINPNGDKVHPALVGLYKSLLLIQMAESLHF